MPLITCVRSELSWLALRSWDSFLHYVIRVCRMLAQHTHTPHSFNCWEDQQFLRCASTPRGQLATTASWLLLLLLLGRYPGLGHCLRLPSQCTCGPLITGAWRSSVHRRSRSRRRCAAPHPCTPWMCSEAYSEPWWIYCIRFSSVGKIERVGLVITPKGLLTIWRVSEVKMASLSAE